MIPKIIHQTWKTGEVPERFRASQDSWRHHHPDWTYMFWTDADLDAFVEAKYPSLWPLFQRYPDQIQRVDAARYMMLHHYGGIYSDLDIICRQSFESLRVHPAFLPGTEPFGYSNDLMGGEAGSPFFLLACRRLAAAHRRWPRGLVPRHFRVLLTTGSLFITAVARAAGSGEPFHVLPGEIYGIGGHPDAFVAHIDGNSWAGWDTHAFIFIHRRGMRWWRYLTRLLS